MSSPENTVSDYSRLDEVDKNIDDLKIDPIQPETTDEPAPSAVESEHAVPGIDNGANPVVMGDPESATFVDPGVAGHRAAR
ncbi:hypothetical protein [Prescottella equi]|uniref:hypothetical protein n=1 Tax=Rhodococcus hoagii TaxID=43767 RepID=UPI001C78916C|nr:hypothetical protein [Prescottella equi]BCN81319.1 hypothetical protein RE0346_49790 [Prescottella equi]